METGFNGFGNAMKALGIGTQQKFDAWYNKALKGREQFRYNIDGFTYDQAQIDFRYKFAEVTDSVTAMATYLDLNSPALPRGREIPMETLEGYIPRQKRFETIGENDLRRLAIAEQDITNAARFVGESPYPDIKAMYRKNLLEFAAQFPESHAQSVTYQVGQMKSNFGLELTDVNNPNGIVGVKFKSHVPESNTHVGEYYTISDEGTLTYDETKHPIQDINKFLRELLFDGTYGVVEAEADEMSFCTFMGHPDIVRAIGYLAVQGLFTATTSKSDADQRASEAGANVMLVNGDNAQVLVGYFKRLFPRVSNVKLHNEVVAVAQLNETTKKFEYPLLKPFNENVLLFRPTGNIGTIKNVAPMRGNNSAFYSRMFEGRGLIETWYNPETKTEYWESELTVLAVPNRPKKLHRFIMGKTVTATYTAVSNPTGNSKTKGYYEKTADGKYVLTTDTTVQESKTYYTKSYV